MSNQYFLDRVAGRNPNLRAADADRERIGERLRTSHAEGRLDLTELQERLERCYEGKTVGELDELVTDLPRPEEPGDGRPPAWFVPLRARLAPFIPILIALIVISAATGHHVVWLWIPLLFLLLRLSWWRRRSWAGARREPRGWV